MTDTAKGSAVDGPETANIQQRMAEAGVASVSELHDLYGKTVQIGDYVDAKGVTHEGGPATIYYCIGDLFMARMANGREPFGNISGIVENNGALSYAFPEGA